MADGDPTPVRYHPRAVLSVVLGAAAFVLLAFEPFVSLVLSLPTITIAVAARREVAASAGTRRGFDLAGMGLAAGAATALLAIVAVFLDLL